MLFNLARFITDIKFEAKFNVKKVNFSIFEGSNSLIRQQMKKERA